MNSYNIPDQNDPSIRPAFIASDAQGQTILYFVGFQSQKVNMHTFSSILIICSRMKNIKCTFFDFGSSKGSNNMGIPMRTRWVIFIF
jgi:hypothetical protein